MGWTGLDQRAFPRIKARCDISIHHPIGWSIKAQTQNVGLGGVCVILNRELEKLSKVHLKLVLEESHPPVQCGGRVVWMVPSKKLVPRETTFDTGIEFLNLNAEDQDRISALIRDRNRTSI